ncbi:hypothetical protein U0X57_31190 [Bacillus thuringiensis]|uniref:hypothetical protein n=2 Tax=Bacillus cereus group TaxID=86661 RepID=UPI0012AE47B2|nr:MULTISPECIES: hypothetical protein [Bacillus cereus group]MEB8817752.1 hypothetical protein [Bacillus cereus]NVO42872.1 hypothetical protein [Bacillus thuringiensis serovar kurstaki]MCR6838320.1 hypothetical protein [Bacillus thuringiensis]MCR6839610.1 hypothetical protein [Bacillus thuringiensis]MCR6844636.1 hypothetical protein [Bacillus thuringiensis]
MDFLLSSQGHLPMSKNRDYENREQLYGIVKVTGGEVGPKIVCTARGYGTWKVTYRNVNRYRRVFCHYREAKY